MLESGIVMVRLFFNWIIVFIAPALFRMDIQPYRLAASFTIPGFQSYSQNGAWFSLFRYISIIVSYEIIRFVISSVASHTRHLQKIFFKVDKKLLLFALLNIFFHLCIAVFGIGNPHYLLKERFHHAYIGYFWLFLCVPFFYSLLRGILSQHTVIELHVLFLALLISHAVFTHTITIQLQERGAEIKAYLNSIALIKSEYGEDEKISFVFPEQEECPFEHPLEIVKWENNQVNISDTYFTPSMAMFKEKSPQKTLLLGCDRQSAKAFIKQVVNPN